MTKSMKLRGLTVAALAATALFAAQPAAANTIELANWWAGAGTVTIDFTGKNWYGNTVNGLHERGGSGGFLTYDLTTDPNRARPFQSFCVDIFHSFSFSISSSDTLMPATVINTAAALDLARLYTNHHAAIDGRNSTAENEAAFQLAVWEIVNEGEDGYHLNSGKFTASGTGGDIAQGWLDELSNVSDPKYRTALLKVDRSGPGSNAQDVVVFTSVPEPQTYAMMLVGLALLGFSGRRKNQNLG